MYTIDDLNVRLLSELKEIAEEMGVKNAKKLSKQDIIYKILDQQAVAGESARGKKTIPACRFVFCFRRRTRAKDAPPQT